VANGLGASIVCRNLSGIFCKDVEDGARRLETSPMRSVGLSVTTCFARRARRVSLSSPDTRGTKIVSRIPQTRHRTQLCLIQRTTSATSRYPRPSWPFLSGKDGYRFNNGQNPTVQVMAVAKRNIKSGECLKRGLGSFVVREKPSR